jgi:hypothetical protein
MGKIITIEDFINKYGLDDFNKPLNLVGAEKVEFYNDLNTILNSVCNIFDKLSNIASLRGALVLLALAKLTGSDSIINKTDVKNSLNIDRLEKLMHAFEYLEKKNIIKIKEKTPKFHIIKLNKEDNPDLYLFQELVKKFWKTPEEKKKTLHKWIKKNDEK